MNPGDVYRPPQGSVQHEDPYAPPPPSDPYAAPAYSYPPVGSQAGDHQSYGGSPPPVPPPPPNPVPNPFNHPLDGSDPNAYPRPSISNSPSYNSIGYGGPPSQPYNGGGGDIAYPPRQNYGDEGYDDSAPLLAPARPSVGFGVTPVPQRPASYQLHDNPGVHFDNPYGNGPDEDGGSNIHYGPLPSRIVRRNRTTKRVQLFQGHLVLDQPVPSLLLDKCPRKDEREFTHMRYSAVTCDPDDFVDDMYTLRQRLYDPPRHTELFIVVTMYNEDDVLFCRTMRGVMQNVAHLCTRNRSKTWGEEGWKKVVVCIVSDGRLKINPRTRSVLAALGVYQEGVAKNAVNGKPVTAHLYEYTTQLYIDSKHVVGPPASGKDCVPVQLMFCLKEKNQKKINSHRWFFNAFGKCLNPNVCVLLDVGTQPGSDSIYHLWKAFDLNSSVGGACGEIVALKGLFWRNLLNPLVAAQNFEYKMSNILDKPLESAFGYITVLPGAFSAYRYIALQNDSRGQGPLEKYFYGETMHGAGAGIFKANMYLAEDRILCWELVSKRNSAWTLHYVKSAYAITDVPDKVPELVSQRRRWLNGSFFAAIHSIAHFGYLYRSSHGLLRQFWLHIEFIYQVINNFFSWFGLGNYFIAFYVLVNSMRDYDNPDAKVKVWGLVATILQYAYLVLLLVCFILALGNRPQGSNVGYTVSMIGFALITVYMVFCAVFLAVKGIQGIQDNAGASNNVGEALLGSEMFRNIIVSLLATYGLYIVSSLISLDPWHLLTSFLQYLLIAPSYINVLNVYAFSNVHDVSWGTKGSDKASEDLGVVKSDGKNDVTVEVLTEAKDINDVYEAELRVLATKAPPEDPTPNVEQQQEDYYKNFRTNVLLSWTISNAALAAGILQVKSGKVAITYMGVMLYTVAGLAAFRFIGACVYLIVRLFQGE